MSERIEALADMVIHHEYPPMNFYYQIEKFILKITEINLNFEVPQNTMATWWNW